MTGVRFPRLALLLGLGSVLLALPGGCRRASPREVAADAPLPAAAPGRASGGPVGAAPAPLVASGVDAGVPRAPGPATDAGAPPRENQGRLTDGTLELPPAPPVTLVTPGADPRVLLRYRLAAGETLRYATRVQQTTVLRSDKTCPAPGAPPRATRTITSTLPVQYGLDLVTRVIRAEGPLLALETRFEKVSLSLPPPLGSQRALLTAALEATAFTTEMTGDGQVRKFQLSQLAGRPLWDDLQRLRTPLGHLQPVFPIAAVGQGARWRDARTLALRETSGNLTARYDTDAEVVSLRPGEAGQAEVSLFTRITVDGKVMGQPYQGSGQVIGRVTLDLRRGVAVKATAESRVCAAVMGRSSENATTYEQTLVP